MNQIGEIEYLANLAAPTVAVITNASLAHLEFVKSVDQVAIEKGRILKPLSDSGIAVLNQDDPYIDYWKSEAGFRSVITYGLSDQADVNAQYRLTGTSSLLEVVTPKGETEIHLNLAGVHNVRNALAAISVGIGLDIPLSAVKEALEKSTSVAGRLQFQRHEKGGRLIDDTYNANPTSMAAAIDVLAGFPGDRRLVMGDMFELGEDGAAYHGKTGEYARRSGIGRLYGLGDLSLNAVNEFGRGAKHYSQWEQIVDDLLREIDSNTTVLVKGSRGMQMERVVRGLRKPDAGEKLSC